MALARLYNLARMTTTTTGTGTITLNGAVDGFLTFAQAGVSTGETVSYSIRDGDNTEVGRGVYTSSGTTLTRSVLKSTNANAAISLTGGAEVFISALAEDFTNLRIGANVKAYGATGDGSTDDTTAIQAAVNAESCIYFPPGTYKTSSAIVVSAAKKLVGGGKGFTTIWGNHAGRTLSWDDVNTYGLTISDMEIKGNGSSTGIYIGSGLEETAHVMLRDLRIYNHDKGIDGVDTYSMFDSVLTKVDFVSCTTFGIRDAGSQNVFVGCTWRLCRWGVLVDNQSGNNSIGGGTFTGCTFLANTFDVVIATPTVRPMSFDGCWFEQTVTTSVGTTEGGEVNFLGLSFDNCLFQPAATATVGGVITTFSYKGAVSFDNCVVFTDLYASASIPTSTSADSNSYVSRVNCVSVNGSAVVTKLRNILGTELAVLDTDSSHVLAIAPGSNLTADRTLTITTGDADRTLDLSAGSATISAYGATLTDDANAAAARTTLGLDSSSAVSFASVTTTDAPSASWSLSSATTTTAITVANNGTYDLATGSGLIMIGASNGARAALITWFGSISIIYQDASSFTVTSGTASKTNVFYNAGTSKFRIENKSGGSLDYYLVMLRMRSTS